MYSSTDHNTIYHFNQMYLDGKTLSQQEENQHNQPYEIGHEQEVKIQLKNECAENEEEHHSELGVPPSLTNKISTTAP